LLSLWDPGLVEEALNFIEENKVNKLCKKESSGVEEVSPLKRIAQQISLNRSHGNYDELMTPDEGSNQLNVWQSLPNSTLNGCSLDLTDCKDHIQFPIVKNERSLDREEKVNPTLSTVSQLDCNTEQNSETNKMFLDTHAMCSSPSANYYKPTDEPEPWDLTQLNIEASVMCLVSKVKFLCGRCGSPSVRIRGHKSISRAQHSFKKDVRPQVGASTLFPSLSVNANID
jgi:inositol polyphosphate-4-phosphatase